MPGANKAAAFGKVIPAPLRVSRFSAAAGKTHKAANGNRKRCQFVAPFDPRNKNSTEKKVP